MLKSKKIIEAKYIELKNRAIAANKGSGHFELSAKYISPRLHSKMLALEWVLGMVSDI